MTTWEKTGLDFSNLRKRRIWFIQIWEKTGHDSSLLVIRLVFIQSNLRKRPVLIHDNLRKKTGFDSFQLMKKTGLDSFQLVKKTGFDSFQLEKKTGFCFIPACKKTVNDSLQLKWLVSIDSNLRKNWSWYIRNWEKTGLDSFQLEKSHVGWRLNRKRIPLVKVPSMEVCFWCGCGISCTIFIWQPFLTKRRSSFKETGIGKVCHSKLSVLTKGIAQKGQFWYSLPFQKI